MCILEVRRDPVLLVDANGSSRPCRFKIKVGVVNLAVFGVEFVKLTARPKFNPTNVGLLSALHF